MPCETTSALESVPDEAQHESGLNLRAEHNSSNDPPRDVTRS